MAGIIFLILFAVGYVLLVGYFAHTQQRQGRKGNTDEFAAGFMVGSMHHDDGDKFF